MRRNLDGLPSGTMIDNSFKAPVWMVKALREHAHHKYQRDSEWLRDAIMAALVREGFNASEVRSDD